MTVNELINKLQQLASTTDCGDCHVELENQFRSYGEIVPSPINDKDNIDYAKGNTEYVVLFQVKR